ncbi:TPA: DUF4113 domain-containing protein [Enterobacter hormaechei]|nr:DUF4113 domain-containing protein [Enterobacter hormaechei]
MRLQLLEKTCLQFALSSLYFASKGTKQSWGMKRELLSPAFTTSWNALPKVR